MAATGVAAVALLVPGVIGCVTYYPYCLSYYSPPLGLQGATRLGMEVTYWGDAFGGAREFVSLPENAGARFYASNELATGVIDALIRGGEVPPQHRLLGRFIREDIPADADYIIVDNHPPMWPDAVRRLLSETPPAATVTCDGVPLLWVLPGPSAGSDVEVADAAAVEVGKALGGFAEPSVLPARRQMGQAGSSEHAPDP